MSSSAKQAVIAGMVRQMREWAITPTELAQAFRTAEKDETAPGAAGRLFSMLGAIFIFAGIGVYISTFWDEMNSAMRISATLGIGLVLHVLSLLMLSGGRYRRAAEALLLIGMVTQTFGWFVAVNEMFPRVTNVRHIMLFVMGVMAVQEAAVFFRYRLTLLLFAVFAFSYYFLFILFDLMGVQDNLVVIGIGASMLFLTQHIRNTPHASLSALGDFIGAALFFSGLFDLLRHSPVELLYFAATVGMVYVSTLVRSSALLAVSTIALLWYIGYFTHEHFVDSVGWPVTLILLGAVFLAVGGCALRLKKRYM